MPRRRPQLLITDLDNTLWDWFEAWFQSFDALVAGLEELSGVPRSVLEAQMKTVHEARGTTEYSNLVREVPALIEAAGGEDPFRVFDSALHAQNSRRVEFTRLYPGVLDTLKTLKGSGVRIVAYTESQSFWTEWRMRHTDLDGVIDVLYSSPDHDMPNGQDPTDLRTGFYDASQYGLRLTEHEHVPRGATKPNESILRAILSGSDCEPSQALYLGDSLIKDITMAQAAGVPDAYAHYGNVTGRPEYDLLRRVTHWPARDVEREREVSSSVTDVVPTYTCHRGIHEILPLFEGRKSTSSLTGAT